MQLVLPSQPSPFMLGLEMLPQGLTPLHDEEEEEREPATFNNIFNGILNMAVPKSKISKSKKKIKKHRYNAKQIQWMRCDRCGEPKLPHRMCEDHKEMCMLADGDYEVYKVDQERKMKEMAEEE